MYVELLVLVIFGASMAFLFNQGLWSNTLTLINVVTAALIAYTYYEPIADWLDTKDATYTDYWDFISIWFLFALSVGIMRTVTDTLSRVKVKFRMPVEKIGSPIMAAWVGWFIVCFSLATLHTAPLHPHFLFGSFQEKPDSKMFFGLAPDHQFLGFAQRMSEGAFRQRRKQVFDPDGSYVMRYHARRLKWSTYLDNRRPQGG